MVSNGGFSYFLIYFKNLTQDVMGTVSQGSQKLMISGPGFLRWMISGFLRKYFSRLGIELFGGLEKAVISNFIFVTVKPMPKRLMFW
jgi:hypothetical protein